MRRSSLGYCSGSSGSGRAVDRRGVGARPRYSSLGEVRGLGGLPSTAKWIRIHAYAHEVSGPIRLTDEELRAHDEWRNFGDELDNHPPMRGWLAVLLIGSTARTTGSSTSDRLEGDFSEQDEANLVRLAAIRRRRHSTRSHSSIRSTIAELPAGAVVRLDGGRADRVKPSMCCGQAVRRNGSPGSRLYAKTRPKPATWEKEPGLGEDLPEKQLVRLRNWAPGSCARSASIAAAARNPLPPLKTASPSVVRPWRYAPHSTTAAGSI